jgi:hypothetical protein
LIPGTGTGGATNPPSTDPASMPVGEEEEEEEEEAEEKEGPGLDLPMTMSASVILTHLPRDASLSCPRRVVFRVVSCLGWCWVVLVVMVMKLMTIFDSPDCMLVGDWEGFLEVIGRILLMFFFFLFIIS